MKRKLFYFGMVQILLGIVVLLVIYGFSRSLCSVLYVLLGLFVIAGFEFILLFCNERIKKTNWYKYYFTDALKFKTECGFNIQVVNLGSNSGKYAFDYSSIDILARNWAVGPQTFFYDYNILKNYFSYLSSGAYVIIPVCPFSFFIENASDVRNDNKYHLFLHPSLISNFSIRKRRTMELFRDFPLVVHVKSLGRLFFDIPDFSMNVTNPMTRSQLDNDAQIWIKTWERQFQLKDMYSVPSDDVQDIIRKNISILRNMVEFCLERELKPVFVIPPVTVALSSLFPEEFRKKYIYSPILQVIQDKEAAFLDYFDDNRFRNQDLFFNSFFLNARGRELFTKQVLMDLNLIAK